MKKRQTEGATVSDYAGRYRKLENPDGTPRIPITEDNHDYSASAAPITLNTPDSSRNWE